MALATSLGYLSYPPPTMCLADSHASGHPSLGDEPPLLSLPFPIWPSFARDILRPSVQKTNGDVSSSCVQQTVDPSASVRLLTYSTPSGHYELLLSPIEPNSSSPVPEETQNDSFIVDMDDEPPQFAMDTVEATEMQAVQPEERNNPIFPCGDQMHWELPFLHGGLVGQSHARHHTMGSLNGSAHENLSSSSEMENHSSSSVIPISIGKYRGNGRSGMHYQSARSQTISATGSGESTTFNNIAHSGNEAHPVVSRTHTEFSPSLAAAAAAELPCTVKLRIWPHNVKDPGASLDTEQCHLTIPHAVLCRYSPSILLNSLALSCLYFLKLLLACPLVVLKNKIL